tara:strand:+ start:1217 stop:1609 length:393 start_codon:yes stop_codon:yes gene_type:complete
MATYMIYQRTNVDHRRINNMPTSVYARAYFALGMPNRDTVEDAVSDGLFHSFYEPTMIMHDLEERDRTPFEAIFDEGNEYGNGSIRTTNIRPNPSMSVGDIILDLTTGHSHVCMPTGWYSLDLTLELTIA